LTEGCLPFTLTQMCLLVTPQHWNELITADNWMCS